MKFKKLLLCVFISLLLLLSACGSNSDSCISPIFPKSLETPKISYYKGVVSWNKIINADKYEISVNDDIFITYKTSYELSVTNEIIRYIIKVKAISESFDYINSEFSSILEFNTVILDKPSISEASFNEERTEASFSISHDLANNCLYISNFTDKHFVLKQSQLNIGVNDITIQACVKDPYICDSKQSFIVTKNDDYTNLRIENGQLIYTENNKDKIYNTSSFPSGHYNKIIRNDSIALGTYFASDGIEITFNKLPPAYVLECYYIKKPEPFQPICQIYLKLGNYNSDYDLTYNRIEIIAYERSSTLFSKSYMSEIIEPHETYTDYIFQLDNMSNPFCLDIILHRDGYLSSNVISHTLK